MKVTYLEVPKGSGSWRLRIETGRDDEGNRAFKYLTIKGSEDDAQRKRFELLNQHEQGTFSEPSKLTLASFYRQWVDSRLALKKICRGSAENYKIFFDTHVAPVLGGMKLQKVRGSDLQALYTGLATGGRLGQSSVAHVHHILSPAFRAARKARLITVNPMEEVDPPQKVKSKPKAIQGEKLQRLIASLPGKWFECPVTVGLAGGLRRGEVLGLRRGDVDLSTGKLNVQGQLVRYKDNSVEWKAPKSAKGVRRVTLPPEAVESLRLHIRAETERRMKLGVGQWKDTDYVFTGDDGLSPIVPNKLTDDFTALCDSIGLDGFTFHGTRHTHITALLKAVGKAGAKAVSERAGHADLGITLEVYQTVFAEDDDELGALSAGIFGGVQKVPGGRN